MTTDRTAADDNVAVIAMVEAHRLEQDENVRLRREVQVLRAEVRALEARFRTSAAQNRKLRELVALGQCADCDEIARAIEAELDDDDIDAIMRTTDDKPVRQVNDVIDIEPSLSAALTRHEVIA